MLIYFSCETELKPSTPEVFVFSNSDHIPRHADHTNIECATNNISYIRLSPIGALWSGFKRNTVVILKGAASMNFNKAAYIRRERTFFTEKEWLRPCDSKSNELSDEILAMLLLVIVS